MARQGTGGTCAGWARHAHRRGDRVRREQRSGASTGHADCAGEGQAAGDRAALLACARGRVRPRGGRPARGRRHRSVPRCAQRRHARLSAPALRGLQRQHHHQRHPGRLRAQCRQPVRAAAGRGGWWCDGRAHGDRRRPLGGAAPRHRRRQGAQGARQERRRRQRGAHLARRHLDPRDPGEARLAAARERQGAARLGRPDRRGRCRAFLERPRRRGHGCRARHGRLRGARHRVRDRFGHRAAGGREGRGSPA
jgi:hypothetical protein